MAVCVIYIDGLRKLVSVCGRDALSHSCSCSETAGQYEQTCPEANENTSLLCECIYVCVCVSGPQAPVKQWHVRVSIVQSVGGGEYNNLKPQLPNVSSSSDVKADVKNSTGLISACSSIRVNKSEEMTDIITTRCVHEGLMRLLLRH